MSDQRQPIYLDYAAATPLDPAALKVMTPYLSDKFYNPSAAYQPARAIRHDVEGFRATVASVLGAKDQEVIFTAGGTEANNLAINGIMSQYTDANCVVSAIEHESVLEPAKQHDYKIALVDSKGRVDVDAVARLIDDKTVLVSVMYANNEVGTIQPIKELAELVKAVRLQRAQHSADGAQSYPIYLHTDACQAANYLDLQVVRLGVDLITLNGGKIYAPKQSGCLYVKTGVILNSQVLGGGQERNLRSGTENVASLSAFATMLQKVQTDRKSEAERLHKLTTLINATLSQNYPDIIINGHSKKRLPNNVHFTLPGADGERLLMELDNNGLLVATGSACTAGSDQPSHVLLAIGVSVADANASLRLTLGRTTTQQEVDQAIKILLSVMRSHIRLV